MKRICTFLIQCFVFVWVLFIPSSLAYHYNEEVGMVNGFLVDYRIPLVAASAILGGCALAVFTVFAVHLRSFNAAIHTLRKPLSRMLVIALIVSVCLQISIALFQFRFQKSLFGYIPFGEVDLRSNLVAKAVFFNGVVYKLPYGTTVHPNILAGFVVTAFLLLLTHRKIATSKHSISLLFLFVALVCFVTQSQSSALALTVGTSMYIASKRLRRIVSIAVLFIPLLTIVGLQVLSPRFVDNTSIQRRAQLQRIALRMVQEHPLQGVGWNNFTAVMEQYGYIPSTTRFLQPVHNVFLLLVAEMGILGWCIIALIVWLYRTTPQTFRHTAAALIILGSFDHYLLTLTTGRMMIVLFFVWIVVMKQEKKRVLPLGIEPRLDD